MFGDRVPFITFFPIVFLLAWWGGFWPTFYAAILSSLVLAYAILAPVGSFYIELPEYRFGLGIFAAVAIATGWLGEKFHTAKRDGQQAIEQANQGGRAAPRDDHGAPPSRGSVELSGLGEHDPRGTCGSAERTTAGGPIAGAVPGRLVRGVRDR